MERNRFGLARDERAVMHAYRHVLTLCGEWVDGARWATTLALFTSPAGVICELCRLSLVRQERPVPHG